MKIIILLALTVFIAILTAGFSLQLLPFEVLIGSGFGGAIIAQIINSLALNYVLN